jgi:PAS domain S-box-containing protein
LTVFIGLALLLTIIIFCLWILALRKQLIGQTNSLLKINEDVQAEISRRRQVEEALKESEERFRQLAKNIDAVFWLATPDMSEMLYVSPTYDKIWERSRKNLYENPTSKIDAIHPDDRLRITAATSREPVEEYNEEYRIVRPDGSIRWISEHAFHIFDESGEIYRIAGVSSDITGEKRLRQEADDRLRQIIQADRLVALGEVVAGVAHEINNPNSFITYNIPLLKETWHIFKPILDSYASAHPDWKKGNMSLGELMKDMHEIIDAIKIGSDRINRVVENLKDFARLDETVHTRPVNVNEVIQNTLTIVGAQLRKSVGEIDFCPATDLPAIEGHFQKLEQVVANILVNAAEFVPDKDVGRVSITTRYLARLESIVIQIEDNGKGMEKNVVTRIFEPFYTTRRASGGTGLGLSVSYGLVKEHNGIIGVLSRPGLGTRFSVFLPVDQKVQLDLNPTILCVDDDVTVLKMVQSLFLRVKDDFVETTSDPESVVAYLEDNPEVDIVLSDIMMPGMDGWELLQKVKTRFPLIAVILYSGFPDLPERKFADAVQPDYFLQKPFQIDQLTQIIDTLGRQRL